MTPAPVAHAGRRPRARLGFAVAGGRTGLLDQYVPYPFHITCPFYLHPSRPDLATLYLQSASGGVYAGDDLALHIEVAAGGAVHITTQSATIVHDCRGDPARLATTATVAADGCLALLPDPLVLFPGAAVASEVDLTLHHGACAIVADSACLHDPRGEGRPCAGFRAALVVRDASGRVLLHDRGGVTGDDLAGAAVLGHWRAWGTLLLLGPAAALADPAALEAAAGAAGCLAGAGAAPGGVGVAVRLVGPDGGTLGRCMAAMAAGAAETLAGCRLSSRGK